MKAILILAITLVAIVQAGVVTEDMVTQINKATKPTHWVATADNQFSTMTREQAQRLLGLKRRAGVAPLPQKTFSKEEQISAPASFDPRENWPQCSTMNDIRDQSDCGSCWAISSASAISDRYCVYLNMNLSMSGEDINSCSRGVLLHCGSCNGGEESCAYESWVKHGIVTEQCYPYSLPSCDHHIPNSPNPCPSNEFPTPACKKVCTGNSADYNKDKHFGASTYSVSGEADMMAELSQHGPCVASISVYTDFLSYKSGVYTHTSGDSEGLHAVKMMGYGITDDGEKYWLLANSWNVHWGEQGYFRVRRGTNEIGIEDGLVCGVPKN